MSSEHTAHVAMASIFKVALYKYLSGSTSRQSGLSDGIDHTSGPEQDKGSRCGVSGRRWNTCCLVCWQVRMMNWPDENRSLVVAWGQMKTSTRRKLTNACKITGVVRH